MRHLVVLTYVLATLTTIGGFVFDARATDLFWNATGGGKADDSSNWTPNQVPSLADDLTFGLGNSYTVIWEDTISNVDTIDVSNGEVIFEDSGGTDLTTTGLFEVGDNSGGMSVLSLDGGMWTAGSSVRIGFQAADDGRLVVAGNASLSVLSSIAVGFRGDGELILNNGTITATGNLNAASATSGSTNGTALVEVGDTFGVAGTTNLGALLSGMATLRVDGGDYTSGGATTINGGSLLEVLDGTYNADGSLALTSAFSTLTINGGELNANAGLDNSVAGDLDFFDGTLTVTGGEFKPNAAGMFDKYIVDGPSAAEMPHLVLGAGATASIATDQFVGDTNRGMLTLTDGAELTNRFGFVGYELGSTGIATVDGTGSTWTSSSNLSVGVSGNGTLNIQDGGTVLNEIGRIGDASNSTGTVTVDGSDSNWTNSEILYVGRSGAGTLTIQNGGLVSNTRAFVGRNSGSVGTVTVGGVGSTWTNTADLTLGGDEFSAGGTGTLTVNSGGIVEVASLTRIWSTGTLSIDGGAFNANAGLDNSSGGVLNLVDGTLTVTGGAFQPRATMTFSLGGPSASDMPHVVLGTGATANFGLLYVSGTGTGKLTLQDGGTVSSTRGIIGRFAGTTGEITVEDTGSSWTNSGNLTIGESGIGTMNVQNGGVVSNVFGRIGDESGSIGTVTVDGAGSTWTNSTDLIVGDSGNGTMNVQNGGVVSNVFGRIGEESGSNGTVTVDGAGSSWTNSFTLLVGSSGNGTVNIHNGGTVSNVQGVIGFGSGSTSTVTVDGMGSTWTNSTGLNVGNSGSGTLNIQNGGTVISPSSALGAFSGSAGTATVAGAGSTWSNTGDLHVGGSSFGAGETGLLVVQNEGLVDVGGELKVWAGGTVNLAGGTLDVQTLDLTETGSEMNMTGGRLAAESIEGVFINQGGTLAPGNSTAKTLSINTYEQQAGTLEIEIGGLVAGTEFDRVTSGAITLAGTLDVQLINGFVPALGDTFEIISSGSVVDTFDTLQLPNLGSLNWDINYNTFGVVLEVVPFFTADFNLDGDVDSNDLNDPIEGWRARFGNDLNGGNFIDWQQQFGSSVPPLAASSAVPEPCSMVLLLPAVVVVALGRRR